jgi:hypothetical protein
VFWARRNNVELRSVQDDSTFSNPLLAFAMGERNMEDSRRKAQAVSAGMMRVAERGRALGIKALGFGIDPDKNNDGRIIVLENEAEIVRRIFREFIAGQSFTAIARNLHRDGVPTRNGGVWRQSTVAGVLRNRVYIGEVSCKGETFARSHEPIIDAGRSRGHSSSSRLDRARVVAGLLRRSICSGRECSAAGDSIVPCSIRVRDHSTRLAPASHSVPRQEKKPNSAQEPPWAPRHAQERNQCGHRRDNCEPEFALREMAINLGEQLVVPPNQERGRKVQLGANLVHAALEAVLESLQQRSRLGPRQDHLPPSHCLLVAIPLLVQRAGQNCVRPPTRSYAQRVAEVHLKRSPNAPTQRAGEQGC